MDMKSHIIAALREEYESWEELLSSLGDAQLSTPLVPSHWTVKDVMMHLWAWQQRSIARVEAALQNREPRFPKWLDNVDIDSLAEDSTDKINNWIYQSNKDLSWPEAHQKWSEGFQRFIQVSEQVSEPVLLASGLFPWLNGAPIGFILLASYDHHKEHYDKLVSWMQEHKK